MFSLLALEGTADLATKALAQQANQPRHDAGAGKGAVRTCVGCRKTGERNELVRLVSAMTASGEKEAVVDSRRRLPGRGAWLHSDPECWNKALKRRAISRALPGVTAMAGVEAFVANNLSCVAELEART